ncbi:uncharacterized protein MICPUCDRAFT_50007 [Micromonas pusilla CCMP1545]|uniref:Predicted protein n=1 Tax=Micromonas pusilla (strain CCMP1545) TaxID=564608 RepID=C1MH07_MICPC|nr:uncharacterized protein MICPUCDRAFT_50007 [Micromonas pusilla CCMP1545]EEH60663.1 predicted protein [Micromonas pusilla CCMP1545]|eukprot:XP_003055411.1 predicted protein [Micromonas pusilla CCMP1545]
MLDKVLQAVVSAGVAVATIKYAGAVGGGANVGVIAENKSVVRKLYREVWNQTDKLKAKTAASKFVSDDHFLIDPSDPSPSPGTDAYMQSVIRLRDAMPNYVIVVDDLIAQGIKVVAQLSYKASVKGREARWTGTAVMELEDGKARSPHTGPHTTAISALIQLGLLQDVVEGAAQFKGKDLQVVEALLGRSEAHPRQVLTGDDWLVYFDRVSAAGEGTGSGTDSDGTVGMKAVMRVDSKTGLDICA